MFRLFCAIVVTFTLLACKRRVDPPKSDVVATTSGNVSPGPHPTGASAPRPAWSWIEAEAHGEHFRMRRFSFRLSEVSMRVVDMRLSRDVEGALTQSAKGLFAINGGFFGTDGAAVGLSVSNGKVLSRFSRTMSGGVLTIQDDRAVLHETEHFDEKTSYDFAVQCRPRLVVDSRVNIRGDDGKRSERSALCIREGGAVLDATIAVNDLGGPSLLALAEYLRTLGCEEALNLDGGPSTGASWRENGGILAHKPRGPVRHALVVVEK